MSGGIHLAISFAMKWGKSNGTLCKINGKIYFL